MADEKLVKIVKTTFSLYGLVLSRKLSVSLAKQLLNVDADEREQWLTKIAEQVVAQNLQDPHITVEQLKLAIDECIKPDTLKNTETVISVINAFDTPKIRYNLPKKKFVLDHVTPDLFSDAKFKSAVFKNRFEILWYRTLRHELFSPASVGDKNEKIKLIPIEYLLSNTTNGQVCVMGLLTQLTEGQYYLEDSVGSIKVDLKQANFQDGLIMEASVVIASGNFADGTLFVEDIGFPPAEPSSNARADFSNSNTFGGPHEISLKTSEKLQIYEENNKDGMIIFMSEIWLDDTTVLDKLKAMLVGYAAYPPIAFVLCGHFLSFPLSVTSPQKLKEGFKALSNIIADFSDIRETSKFIFVPAPDDLGAPKILPRGPLPKSITDEFSKNVPGAIFATNPCRIQYCTKEIVVLREDVLTKMCRNTLYFPNEGNIFDHCAKSIISQSHLTPLSLSIIPVYWKHDHALQIYPTPDLIVIADQFEAFETKYSNCHVFNPGLFPKNNHSFKVYVPSINLVEHCAIPKDEDGV